MNAKLHPLLDQEDRNVPLDWDMPTLDNKEESVMSSKTSRIWGLLGKMPDEISSVMLHPLWSGVMDTLLSQDTADFFGTNLVNLKSSYTLSIANSFTIYPGAERQAFHRDQLAQMVQPDGTGHTSMISCLIAGTNVTRENGATMVVKGSHLWGKDRYALREEAISAEMTKCSALFFLGSTLHGKLAGSLIGDQGLNFPITTHLAHCSFRERCRRKYMQARHTRECPTVVRSGCVP
jgi:hypothetical protein